MSKATASEKDLIELSKLRWHCRRGVKELDVVFNNYLDNHYLHSSTELQKAFREIMTFEDPVIMDLIMAYRKVEDPSQNIVLAKMKQPYS